MEDKYKKTLQNVLILANEEIIEICTKKSYFDRIPQDILNRKNLCKLLSKNKKCRHFGLNIKEKRLHKKVRHYTMKIVNFNTLLIENKTNNEYYVVFYRSDLSFNANIANFYFSGIRNTTNFINKRKKNPNNKRLIAKILWKRVVKKKRNPSFKNYLKHTIKEHFAKYLNGNHSLISVHAIFKMDDQHNQKIFITRDIQNYSDINKFIQMINAFDPTLKCSVNRKLEDYLENLNIPMNNVLVIAQINQSKKNLFIQWNDKLIESLHRKITKNPSTQLINTNMLNLRLNNISFNGVECSGGKSFVDVIDNLMSKNCQDDNIEKKLEKQLNSCKTFIACLDAFETSQMSDITKVSQNSDDQTTISSSTQGPISEITDDVGDTMKSKSKDVSITSDQKVQGILTKIDTLQKRIRFLVKTSPSLHKDVDIQYYLNQASRKTKTDSKSSLCEVKSLSKDETDDVLPCQQNVVKRDILSKSKFCKPVTFTKEIKGVQSNLVESEKFLKRDIQEVKTTVQDVAQNENPKTPESTKSKHQENKIKESEIPTNEASNQNNDDIVKHKLSEIEKLLKSKLENPDPEFEKFFKILQDNKNSDGFKRMMQHLEEKYEKSLKEVKPIELISKQSKQPTLQLEKSKSTLSKQSSKDSNSLKSIFAAKNMESRSRSKQKRSKKAECVGNETPIPNKPAEQTVTKLENFIEQILHITKIYFANGGREAEKNVQNIMESEARSQISELLKTTKIDGSLVSKTNTSTIITIKKYKEMDETKSEISTNTVNSFVRKEKMTESGVQTERNRKKKLHTKLTQTDIDAKNSIISKGRNVVAMETQTDISIHKHAQIKFSGINMQLSKNVTITNVRKNVINVRNICEETSEAVKRLLEKETVFNEDNSNLKQVVETISEDLRTGKNKAEILGQIKNTLENVIDRFKKSTLLISKATNFTDITDNLKNIMVPTDLPVTKKNNSKPHNIKNPAPVPVAESTSSRKEEIASNLTMSLKLLKNLSEVTKTIRKNPKEAAKKLHGIRNELMHYRKNNLYNTSSSKISTRLYLPKTSSTLTSKQSKNRVKRTSQLFPKNVPLNMYGYPVSHTDMKPDLNELNRIFTPKTRSICNTELSIIKHRDRHADHIASHLNTNPSTKSKYCFDFKKFRSKSAQLKSHKCQMYIAKTYKKSYANSLSQTACTPSNVPQIQTAIENPLVPKIVRPVRWKNPLPESPQLSNLSLKDVKPFNSEYPRKDHVSASSHSYLDRLLETPEKHVPTIKCSDNECAKCSEKTSPFEVSICGKSPKETTDLIVKKGDAHFKTETPKRTQEEVTTEDGASVKFDFGKFMVDPDERNLNIPKVNFTVYPVNILQNKSPETQKNCPSINTKLSEVKNNQNKVQRSIQKAIIQNQEKFQAMQRIITLSKPQERKITNPPSIAGTSSIAFKKSSSVPPKIKSTHTKNISKTSDPSTSKSRSLSVTQRQNFSSETSNSVQTAVTTYKTVKQVQPHPKLKQLQQHQIPLKPKTPNRSSANKKTIEQKTSATFNKKYSDVSLSSLRTITKDEKQSKTVTQNVKNVKRSQEDIQKYIALVEQKFLKTFSLNEQDKEGAYKNLVDEIQGMLNVLNSKDKNEKKMKIKKSLEKLTKETENTIKQPLVTITPKTPIKQLIKNETAEDQTELVNYTKTLESVEKSLKDFKMNCEENNKISEIATEKLLNWKTTKSTDEDLSKASVCSKSSIQYTLSEKERIIEEKLTEFPGETTNNQASIVIIKDPVSMATMEQQTSESEAVVLDKKKNYDFSGPTMLSTTLNSSDSLIETDEIINYSGLSMNSFSKVNPKQNLRLNKSQNIQKYKTIKTDTIIHESPYSTDTSLIPYSNDNTEDGYLTITEFSETNSSNSEIKITPLVEFSVEMYLCDYLHYSYKCQKPLISIIPHIYQRIHYTERIEVKPITQAYKKKYNTTTTFENKEPPKYEYPVSSSLNFSNILTEDSYNIEQDFIKNYSDKLFTESLNTILSKNSEFTFSNLLGNTSTERLVKKTNSNFCEYIDLLSNISRIFIEPEIAQFYQPKFISYITVPERETRTYYITIIFCRVQFNYAIFNPSKCNLLNFSESNISVDKLKQQRSITNTLNYNSASVTQNSTNHLSATQNTVSEFSDLTSTQFSSTSMSTADLFSEIPQQILSKNSVSDVDSMNSEPYYSVNSSITKFEFINDNVEIQTVTRLPDENTEKIDNMNILIQNIDLPNETIVEIPINDTENINNDTLTIFNKKPSVEELYVENVCFATKKSSTYFNVDNFNVEMNCNDDETTDNDETNDKIVKTVDFKRLSHKLAQQSNELGQLLINNQYKRRLPKIVSVKNFNTHKFLSNPVLNRYDYNYDCNYDLKLTISPKYLSTNFPSATCMEILPLLKNRIRNMSHSLTMKIELNNRNLRTSIRNISFKKPKRNIIVYNKNNQKDDAINTLSLIQVQRKEIYAESYRMILIFLYVSIFSFIFICMTLNYRCD